VKDFVSAARLLDNPHDEVAWYRLLRLHEHLGPARARALLDEAKVRTEDVLGNGGNGGGHGAGGTGEPVTDTGRAWPPPVSPVPGPAARGRPPVSSARWSVLATPTPPCVWPTWTAWSAQPRWCRHGAWLAELTSTRRRRPATWPGLPSWTRTTWSFPPSTRPRAWSGRWCTCRTSSTG